MIPASTWKTLSTAQQQPYRFADGYNQTQYLADEKTRAAVERALEICGEALRQLHRLAPDIADSIPHAREIVGFRNILAHGYAELDHAKVYIVVSSDAPKLLTAVRDVLVSFPAPEN